MFILKPTRTPCFFVFLFLPLHFVHSFTASLDWQKKWNKRVQQQQHHAQRGIVRDNVMTNSFFVILLTGTLWVSTWMHKRGLSTPRELKCSICELPEAIEPAFLHCWAAVFLLDVFQRTIHTELPLHQYGLRFLRVNHEENAPFD